MATDVTALELLLSMVQYHKEYLHKLQVNKQDEANLLKQSAATCETILQSKTKTNKEQALYHAYIDLQQNLDPIQANTMAQKLIHNITAAQKSTTPADAMQKAMYGVSLIKKKAAGAKYASSDESSSDDDNWD